MSHHVVVGAGPIGSGLARLLAAQGEQVRLLSRSGRAPAALAALPEVTAHAVDARDAAALRPHLTGARALYNCASPAGYQRWAAEWPSLAAGVLAAAEASGAVLVTMSNLYGYGPVAGAMTPDLPLAAGTRKGSLRARLWQQALAAHEAGRVRATEVRASDYVGPTTTPATGYLARSAHAVLRGRTAYVLGDPDVPHTFTAVEDAVRTLAAAGADERALGRPWHVPSPPAVSVREALTDVARLAGVPPVPVRGLPAGMLRAVGLVVPAARELAELMYQFDRPFVLDAAETTRVLGVMATPWAEVLTLSVPAWREQLGQARAA